MPNGEYISWITHMNTILITHHIKISINKNHRDITKEKVFLQASKDRGLYFYQN